MTTKICPSCGIEFGQGKRPAYIRDRTYCSSKCAATIRNQNSKQSNAKTVFICKWCKNPFEDYIYRNPQCCCKDCATKYRTTIPDTRICLTCGKEFPIERHTRVHRYCSRDCANEGRSRSKQGANNPKYRYGTKYRNRGKGWYKISHDVLRRDSYKCQVCGKQIATNKWDYGVHHIIPYHLFNGNHKIANQLNNLITLCRQCHAKVESGKLPCPKPLR